MSELHILSWNVNGLRAAAKKGFGDWLESAEADAVFLQEVRALPEQIPAELREPSSYFAAWNPASKKGYSGVGLLARQQPESLILGGLDEPRFDDEGRLIIADIGGVLVYGAYFPNGGRDHSRVAYKLEFSRALQAHALESIKSGREVVICGDINTAHEAIDLARPKANKKTTGFLPEERAWISELLDSGFVDAFRHLYPDRADSYTWWSNRSGARERNVGWRLDCFYVSAGLADRIVELRHHDEVTCSDHCPIRLVLST